MAPKEITQFYEIYKKRLFNISLRIVGNSMDAEEVAHDVILKFLRFDSSQVVKEQREAWLCKSCVRASIDVVRKRAASQKLFDGYDEVENESCPDIEKHWNDVISINEKKRMIQLIYNNIRMLPDGYRVILSLILFEGYDYQEVASLLHLKESSVRSQYLRGKRKLLDMMKEVQ